MKQDHVVKGVLWSLAAATILLAILQLLEITSNTNARGRVSSLGEGPGITAILYSLGLISLFGIAYGRQQADWKGRLLFWLGFGMVGIAIVQTGARGPLLALAGSLAVFLLRGKTLGAKLKFGVIGLAGIIVLAVASYQIDAVRKRWETTFYDADLSGRQEIYREAIGMILESPLIGWGPVNHHWELGPRVGLPYRDEHNLVLFLLAEGGLLGALPFFAGLWLCWREAWKGRHGSQGVLPVAMLAFLSVVSLNQPIYGRKIFWLVLSYALAAGSYYMVRRELRVSPVSTSRSGIIRHMGKFTKVQRESRLGVTPVGRIPRS
jgi:O-antigen ligase